MGTCSCRRGEKGPREWSQRDWKKSGNNILVTIKKQNSWKLKSSLNHMNRKETKVSSEVMHIPSLVDPARVFFCHFWSSFLFVAAVRHPLSTQHSTALNTADKLFQFHSGPSEQTCGSITFHRWHCSRWNSCSITSFHAMLPQISIKRPDRLQMCGLGFVNTGVVSLAESKKLDLMLTFFKILSRMQDYPEHLIHLIFTKAF